MNQVDNIKVSIIMATFNRRHFIEDSLESIWNQSFLDWECLIIDDGSTDETESFLTQYIQSENRFKYYKRISEYKKGLPGCRNYGLDLAQGKFVVFFDDDDIAHPRLLELSVKEIEKQNVNYCRYLRAIFVGEFQDEFDLKNNYEINSLKATDLDLMITGKIPFNSCQVLWKKECFADERFDETLMFAEEWECYSRILARGFKGISLQKVLYFGRKHERSNTGEFKNNDPVRLASKIKAAKLIISNLAEKDLLKPTLIKFFIRMGFRLKEYSLIEHTLKESGADRVTILKFKLGYIFYPFLKSVFKFKGKIPDFLKSQ